MSITYLKLVLLLVIGLGTMSQVNHSFAQDREPNALEKSYQALFQKLIDGTAEQQIDAERELLEIGPDVLMEIPILPTSAPLEKRETLDRVRGVLQSKVIEAFAKPSVVTFQGSLVGADALIEIMEQTGNTLIIDKAPPDDIDVDFESTPFWEALDRVLDDLSLKADPFADTQGLRLVPKSNRADDVSNEQALRRGYAGIFRFEPTRVSATRSLERAGLSSLSIDLQVAWEPRLKPVYCRFPMKTAFAECDNGEILRATSPESSPEYSPAGAHAIEANLQFHAPSRQAKSLRLQGSIEAMIPGGVVSVEFDELEKTESKSQTVGKLNVTLEQAELREDILEANLLVSVNNAGESMDSFRGWVMNNECFLQTPDNERIKFGGLQTYKMNGTEVGMTYFFDLSSKPGFAIGKGLAGYRLVYNAPGAVVPTKVDFVLQDIPLP
jgi:hypothetical protein